MSAARPDWMTVLRLHIARDRYRDDGESIGTECTCGGWSGGYFADGEDGPFDLHLASALDAAYVAHLGAEETREAAWGAIARVRDASPRTTDDADSWDVLRAALATLTDTERTDA